MPLLARLSLCVCSSLYPKRQTADGFWPALALLGWLEGGMAIRMAIRMAIPSVVWLGHLLDIGFVVWLCWVSHFTRGFVPQMFNDFRGGVCPLNLRNTTLGSKKNAKISKKFFLLFRSFLTCKLCQTLIFHPILALKWLWGIFLELTKKIWSLFRGLGNPQIQNYFFPKNNQCT